MLSACTASLKVCVVSANILKLILVFNFNPGEFPSQSKIVRILFIAPFIQETMKHKHCFLVAHDQL